MSKKEKQIPDRKHIIRRCLIIASIGIGVAVLGTAGVVAFLAAGASNFLAVQASVLALGAGVVAIGSAGTIATIDGIRRRHNTSVATKSLEKLRGMDSDKPLDKSSKRVARICRRFAKSSLKLCKIRGGSIYGSFSSQTGLSDRETLIRNKVDQLAVLEKLARTKNGRKKYSTLKRELQAKLPESTPHGLKWTKGYYVDSSEGVAVFDRRNEISCLTKTAKERFIKEFGTVSGKPSKVGYSITFNFPNNSSIYPTYINTEREDRVSSAVRLLLTDVLEMCETKSQQEAARFFPIEVETKSIKRNSTAVVDTSKTTFRTLKEVKEYLGVDAERDF